MALLFLTTLASACAGPTHPPAELNGLWSSGPAACAAGIGVRFESDKIEVVYEDSTQTLFEHPRYNLESNERSFRVRITYDLPRVTGGTRVAGAHGVLVLARQSGGGLAPVTHSIVDARTGSQRMRIANDPVVQALTLTPCGAHPWREDLRGREA
ncbi:MAG: hypothetical protein IPG56_01385 [Caulobacteraceae bacterium]|nr:hypothetical protein [Caulobacteraceae bacterium]